MKSFTKVIMLIVIGVLLIGGLSGCVKPYDKPELASIEPSQTAFLIPLEGKTSDQAVFESEDLLAKAKIAVKQVQIPHRWLQEGRWNYIGRYIPTAKLIVVERKPETREWTASQESGTATINQGVKAETKESIALSTTMNCSAQINEEDAVRFLYRYNNKPLSEIMDSEIRNKITGKFVEECAKYTLTDLLLNKAVVMKTVRDDVVPYFKEKGITITTIALNGDFVYDNADIQSSIDDKFKSAQTLITQKNENEKMVNKAKADAEAIKIQASILPMQIKLKTLEVEMKKAEAEYQKGINWRPTTIINGSTGTMLNIPTDK